MQHDYYIDVTIQVFKCFTLEWVFGLFSVLPAARGLPLCLSMMSPFQGAHSTPHSWVMAKALVYWLTAQIRE